MRALPHGGSADGGGRLVGWSRPGLGVTSGSPGEVEQAGDLFLVDTTSAPDAQHASLYVTNAAAVARSLRGFVLPIALWAQAGDGTWRRTGERFVTESGGGVALTLDPGRVYAVSLERGGSFVGSGGAPVAPAFYLAL